MYKLKRQTTLPAHVQGKLKQEERLLEQALDHLNRETANTIRLICQEQQLLTTKLKTMENKLTLAKERSRALLHVQTSKT